MGHWPAVLAALRAAESLRPTGPDEIRNYTFGTVDEYGRELTVRLDAVPLPAGQLVRVFANTTSDNHVIQLSDQLTPEQEGPMLAAGVSELLAVRWRADVGAPAVRRTCSTVLRPACRPIRRVLCCRTATSAASRSWTGWRHRRLIRLWMTRLSRLPAMLSRPSWTTLGSA